MELFDYLMAKKGHNTHRDLFSYLLGKNAGGSGTYTTFSGISLNISNTLQAKIKNIALEGNTSQDGTPTPDTPIPIKVVTGEQNVEISGKNLFNLYDHTNTLDDYTTIISPNKYTCNASSAWKGRVIVPISNFKKNTDYTFSYTSNSTRTYINEIRGIKDGVTTIISNGAYYYYVKKFTINTSDYDKIVIDMYARGNGGTATQVTISNLQLEEGSTVTKYEPYQSQNYPISLSSKNLFDYHWFGTSKVVNWTVYEASGGKAIPIYIGVGNSATFSSSIPVNTSSRTLYAVNTIATAVSNSYFDSQQTRTVQANEEGYVYLGFFPNRPYYSDLENNKYYIQIEIGQTATPYEPYYNIEYCKIGNYADQIFKNTTDSPYYDNTLVENEWYLKKNIGKVVLDGSESEWTNAGGNAPYKYTDSNIIMSSSESDTNLLSNYYPCKKWSDTWTSFDYMVVQTRNGQSIQFRNVDISTLEEFKVWLSTHNTTVYYPLATSQYIHISQEEYPTLKAQLDNLYNNAKSYNGQTNITQTNDDLPFNISVDVKVLDTNLNMSNSLNSSLLNENINDIQNEEEPNEDYQEL